MTWRSSRGNPPCSPRDPAADYPVSASRQGAERRAWLCWIQSRADEPRLLLSANNSPREGKEVISGMKKIIAPAILAFFGSDLLFAQTANQSASQDRATIYNLGKTCAEEGRKWLKSNGAIGKPTDPYYSYKIHYSVKLNGCFLLQRNTVYDDSNKTLGTYPYRLTVIVVDIHSDDGVADYAANYHPERGLFINLCRLPPDDKVYCKIHGKASGAPMDDRDSDITKEWADAIEPYMEE